MQRQPVFHIRSLNCVGPELFSAIRLMEKAYPLGRVAPGLKNLDTAARPSQVPLFRFFNSVMIRRSQPEMHKNARRRIQNTATSGKENIYVRRKENKNSGEARPAGNGPGISSE